MILTIPCDHGFNFPHMCPHGCHTAMGCTCEPERIEKHHAHVPSCPMERMPPEITYRLDAVRRNPDDRHAIDRLYASILRFGERSEAERLAVAIADAMVSDDLSEVSFRRLPRSIKDKVMSYRHAVDSLNEESGKK